MIRNVLLLLIFFLIFFAHVTVIYQREINLGWMFFFCGIKTQDIHTRQGRFFTPAWPYSKLTPSTNIVVQNDCSSSGRFLGQPRDYFFVVSYFCVCVFFFFVCEWAGWCVGAIHW